ncbi:MAG: TolC family protein [Saprospiraceae bacterium]|nr:TolC family protein [Saprospiraceae bacterium]
MNYKILSCIGLLILVQIAQAQPNWNLVQCIEHAMKNNIGLQQSQIAVQMAELDFKTSKHQQFPDLSAGLNGGISFGRNVDPTTNSFTTEDILYSNYNLSSSVVLFQSGLIRNSIKQSKLNLNASKEDYNQVLNDLSLSIASFYLNVLLADERLEVAGRSVEVQQLQLDQIEKLIKAGVKPEADALEIKSQVARAEQTVVLAQNALELAWLQLKQAMRIDPETKMQLAKLSDEQLDKIQLEIYSFKEIIPKAEEQQASLRAAKNRLEAARLGEKMARALLYPSVYASASIGSRFSDAAIRPTSYTTERLLIPGVRIDDQSVKFEQDYPVISGTEVIPFQTQFDQFLGYGVGVSVSIPIYKNYNNQSGLKKAKLTTKLTELDVQQKRINLDQNLITAIANVKAAIKEREAAMKSFEAGKSAFDKTSKKFQIGAASAFELNVSQANLQTSEINLLIAKYDLVFKQKLLDYYAGKRIEL